MLLTELSGVERGGGLVSKQTSAAACLAWWLQNNGCHAALVLYIIPV